MLWTSCGLGAPPGLCASSAACWPEDEPQPTRAERDQFVGWVSGQLKALGREIRADKAGKKARKAPYEAVDLLEQALKEGNLDILHIGIAAVMASEGQCSGAAARIRTGERAPRATDKASKKLRGPKPVIKTDRAKFVEQIRQALYASKIISYAQGYMLMRAAAEEYKWKLNWGGIALMWRGGCIIRSRFLGKIKEAFDKQRASLVKADCLDLGAELQGTAALDEHAQAGTDACTRAIEE